MGVGAALAASSRLDGLLEAIRPSPSSEFRRLTIAHYLCGVIKQCFQPNHQVEAFMFGSVPLRAVLPDGDIDISVFATGAAPVPNGTSSDGEQQASAAGSTQPAVPALKNTWASQLLRALEKEAACADAPFQIRDAQIIQAEVKLVKCVVSDVVVDVSLDTIGGLCTVAFLEAADRRIGRQHLFKRSILLLKAWCYYESRLLGAHHGLISSYALEVLVLYIFNLHHAELHTPLDVLRRFLSVLGSFDWEHYCLTLQGPLPIATLQQHDCSVDLPSDTELLLDGDFMRDVLQRYSVQQAEGAAAAPLVAPHFPLKHLNIVDPLLPSNNLGRSVSKASYARVKKALLLGSRTLEEALLKDPRSAVDTMDHFFRNTWRSPVRMAADNQTFLARLSSIQLPAAATEAVVTAAAAAGFHLPGSSSRPSTPGAAIGLGMPLPAHAGGMPGGGGGDGQQLQLQQQPAAQAAMVRLLLGDPLNMPAWQQQQQQQQQQAMANPMLLHQHAALQQRHRRQQQQQQLQQQHMPVSPPVARLDSHQSPPPVRSGAAGSPPPDANNSNGAPGLDQHAACPAHGSWAASDSLQPAAAATPLPAGGCVSGSVSPLAPAGVPQLAASAGVQAAAALHDSPHSFFGGDLAVMEHNLAVARQQRQQPKPAAAGQGGSQSQGVGTAPGAAVQPPPVPPPAAQQQPGVASGAGVPTAAVTAAGSSTAPAGGPVAPLHQPLARPGQVQQRYAPPMHISGRAELAAAPAAAAEPEAGRQAAAVYAVAPTPGLKPAPGQPAAGPAAPHPFVGMAGTGHGLAAAMAVLPAVRTRSLSAGGPVPAVPHALPVQVPVQPSLPVVAPHSPPLQHPAPPPLPIVPRAPVSEGSRSPMTFAAALRASSRSSSSSASLASPAAAAAHFAAAPASLGSSPSRSHPASGSGTPLAASGGGGGGTSGGGGRRQAWGRAGSSNLAVPSTAVPPPPVGAAPAAAAPAGQPRPQQRSWSAVAAGSGSRRAPAAGLTGSKGI
ncbi:hypothetical protein D9Q98_003995 [Chlorella vulgaris]|uniref:PAP/OAS1 substrate-binding-related domain-containing protein n=1 Tax=Chlorella vulgaris TaxID=3077 RepID=A0A9D4YY77_CHLVU|nr:hypothetical protein D9Q98_003995 [Chlorella vulgaris]